ncbi:MAG: DsbA family oxidoreductase [Acidimicrobiales bacterium]
MLVEIWSDVICPWCYLGKRRFESALSRFTHRDEVEVRWRSFELDPRAPIERDGDLAGHLARKYHTSREKAEARQARLASLGAADGVDFDFTRARPGNTFDAHRMLHLAEAHGCRNEAEERLFRAYFSEGQAIGLRPTLERLMVEVGLDAGEVARSLAGDDHGEAVRADEAEAIELDVAAVPFFRFDRRAGLPGAQEVDVMLRVLERTWESGHRA